MLYKVFESAPYALLSIAEAADHPYIRYPDLLEPPREYGEALTFVYSAPDYSGVKTIWTRPITTETGYSLIYAIVSSNVPWREGLPGIVACWDAGSGNLLWIDRNTWSPYELDWGLWRLYMLQDDVGRVWSCYRAGVTAGPILIRHPNLTEQKSLYPAGQVGELDLMTYDYSIEAVSLLTEDGTEVAVSSGLYIMPLAIHWGSGKLIYYHLLPSYVNGDPSPYENSIAVYSASTYRRLGYIPLREKPFKALCGDGNTVYVIGDKGAVEVIDLARMLNVGTLAYDYLDGMNIVLQYDSPLNKNQFCYDRTYRRLLSMPFVPDDPVTGECYTCIVGHKMQDVGLRVTPPIAVRVPREEGKVHVVSQVYGTFGTGIPGVPVTFTVDDPLADPHSELEPSTVATDASGYAKAILDCGSSGLSVLTITAEANAEQVLSGIGLGEYTPSPLSAPTQVIAAGLDDRLFPGWWLSSRATSASRSSIESVVDEYLSDFEDGYNPFVGAMVEYAWSELHTDFSTYDFSKVTADVAYLASKGMKMMISIRTSPYEAGTGEIWVPDFIINDDSELFPASGNVLGKRGVFASYNSSSSYDDLDTVLPLLCDSNVRAMLSGLVGALSLQFGDSPAWVGLAPCENWTISSAGISNAVLLSPGLYTVDDVWEAKRQLLTAVSSSSTYLTFDWLFHTVFPVDTLTALKLVPTAHSSWCVENGINLLSPYFFTHVDVFDLTLFVHAAGALLSANDRAVATGIQVPSWAWEYESNINCLTATSSPRETMVGGPTLSLDECQFKAWVEKFRPWFNFVEVGSGTWDGEEGIKETCQSVETAKHLAYMP